MTRVYIVRHAEAEGNLYRRIHGWYDSRVTQTGLRQLEILKDRFKNVKIDAVYSSDLLRARLTAEAVAYGSGVPVIPTARLREVNMGVWEDRTWGEVLTNQREQYTYFYSRPDKWNVPGCESFGELQDRLENAVIDLAAENYGKTIALVTHGCAIRSLMARIRGVAAENIFEVPYCDNTGISLLEVTGRRIEIISHNDSAHIPDELTRFRRQKWRKSRDGFDNSNLWFSRDGDTYSAIHFTSAAGILTLDPKRGGEDKTGYIAYYLLDPDYRGLGMSVQLLGQAVSAYRDMGRDRIVVELENNPELSGYFRHYGFTALDPHTMTLDISLDQTL
jgi:probable phosphoglycerate mutase